MPANDIEVIGTYTINSYKITYKVDGEVYQTETLTYGADITLIEQPTREGYTFSGWSEVPETMPANDIEVIGTYTINSYKVLISSTEGGRATTSADEAQYNSSVTLSAIPEEGYEFVNWTLNGEEVSTDSIISIVITEDVEYVANFKKIDTAIRETTADSIRIYIANQTLYINDYVGVVRVINFAGKLIIEQFVNNSAQLELERGVYIVTTKYKTQKIIL